MRKLTIAALIAGQILTAAPPVFAADLTASEQPQMGAFGGLRVRVPLGGDPRERQVRAGLAIAPTVQGGTIGGERRQRIGEGIEFGYRSNRPLTLSVAGMDLRDRRLRAAQDDAGDDDGGVPTWAIVVGGIVVALATGYLVFAEMMDCDEDEECS